MKDKRLLITGGTGSFGNTVLDHYLNTDIGEIVIFSRDEKKQEDMRLKYNEPRLKFVLGDVRDSESIRRATRGIDYVFHAAALKQVPSAEFNAHQAVQTNIVGTHNLIESSIDNKVESVVVLSTDKAVYPINAMGISKAMAEKLVYSASIAPTGTKICCTRYGNVMASRGSVIPLFIDRIMNNEYVTITDPTMTRFLMSLEESVGLVNYAFNNGASGDLFVRKSPSTTVENIVKALEIMLNKKAKIKYIGHRHGEKKHETLVSREELLKAKDEGDYYRVIADVRSLNYEQYISEGAVPAIEQDYTSENADFLDVERTVKLITENREVQAHMSQYAR